MPYQKPSKIRELNNILKIKQAVYRLTFTESTNQLKNNYPELTRKKDLRKKENWISLYNTLKLIDNFQQEQTSKQLAQEFGFTNLNHDANFQNLLRNAIAIRKLIGTLERKFSN